MSLEATAHLVALHHKIGTVERRRATPSAHPPTLIKNDYGRALVGMIGDLRKATQPLFDALPDLITAARRYRTDDTSDGRRANALLERARSVVARQAQQASYIAKRYADQAVKQQSNEFSRQTKAALGVELQTLDRGIPTRVGHFAHENAQKIQSLGEQTLGDVARIVAEGFTNDRSVDDIAAELQKRFDVAETYARLLASDQIKKLTAQVARMRHQEVGVTVFRWRTSGGPNVRPSHAVKHDKIFPYDGSRAPSFFPGDEPGCNCQAIPVFDDIASKAMELAGKGRKRVV